MRLAVYNVENLFDRPRTMSHDTWAEGEPVLNDFAELSRLLGQPAYTDKPRMVALMQALGLTRSDTGPFAILRRNRGGLVRRPRAGGLEITADGRADWVGSLELRRAPINEHAMRNTARVIADLGADVLGIVEADNRPVLAAFNRQILPAIGSTAFRHVMLIDGNDERGIDVGLVSRTGFPIGQMQSRVDDTDANGQPIFSRDCPQFEISTPAGNRLLVLVNHFKSKGYGGMAASNARRRAQAARVAAIYAELTAAGETHVAIMGDLNDTPDSAPLAPLLQDTDLADVFTHPAFDNGGYPGTYDNCSDGKKIDYMLLSPALFAKVIGGGVCRKGIWPGIRAQRWPAYPELTRPEDAASDHAAIWADIDL